MACGLTNDPHDVKGSGKQQRLVAAHHIDRDLVFKGTNDELTDPQNEDAHYIYIELGKADHGLNSGRSREHKTDSLNRIRTPVIVVIILDFRIHMRSKCSS